MTLKRLRLWVSLPVVMAMWLTRVADIDVQWQQSSAPHRPPTFEVIEEWADAAGDLSRHGPLEGQLDLTDQGLSSPGSFAPPSWPCLDLIAALPAMILTSVPAPPAAPRDRKFHVYRPPQHLRQAPRAPPALLA